MIKETKNRWLVEVTCVFLSIFILLPFYIVTVNSFKGLEEAAMMSFKLPEVWVVLENYMKVFKSANILRAFINSLIISISSVSLIIVCSSMAGFVIQRRKDRWIQVLFNIILVGMIIPANLVNTYFLCKALHLTTSLMGIIVVLATLNVPVSTFIYVGFYKSIPREIDEAAIVDGCGTLRLFFNIIFPLLKPATATVIIINFIAVWNDFTASIFFLNSPKKVSMVLTQYLFMGAKASEWNLVFADVVLCSLPMLIIFFIFQRHIISGMVAGSVKG